MSRFIVCALIHSLIIVSVMCVHSPLYGGSNACLPFLVAAHSFGGDTANTRSSLLPHWLQYELVAAPLMRERVFTTVDAGTSHTSTRTHA